MFWSWINALRRNSLQREQLSSRACVCCCFRFFSVLVLHWLLKYLFRCLLLLRLVQRTGFHTPLLSEDWCCKLFSSREWLSCLFQNKIPPFGVTLTLLILFMLFFGYEILPNLSTSWLKKNVAYSTVQDS